MRRIIDLLTDILVVHLQLVTKKLEGMDEEAYWRGVHDGVKIQVEKDLDKWSQERYRGK